MKSHDPLQRKSFISKYWFIIAAILIILVVAFLLFKTVAKKEKVTQEKTTTTETKAALTVSVIQPERQNWKQTLTANGNIAAWQEVVIGSELSGQRISKVYVNVGDSVKRG